MLYRTHECHLILVFNLLHAAKVCPKACIYHVPSTPIQARVRVVEPPVSIAGNLVTNQTIARADNPAYDWKLAECLLPLGPCRKEDLAVLKSSDSHCSAFDAESRPSNLAGLRRRCLGQSGFLRRGAQLPTCFGRVCWCFIVESFVPLARA